MGVRGPEITAKKNGRLRFPSTNQLPASRETAVVLAEQQLTPPTASPSSASPNDFAIYLHSRSVSASDAEKGGQTCFASERSVVAENPLV